MTVDVVLHATKADIRAVDFSLGLYDANLALAGTVIVPPDWHLASPSRNVHVHFRWNQSVEGAETRFVNCAINSVELSDGTHWTQAPDYTQRDWKGNPIRRL